MSETVKRTYKQQTSWILPWKTARINWQGVSEKDGNGTIERILQYNEYIARCIFQLQWMFSRHSFAIHSWKLTRQWYQMFVNFPLTLLWWCIIWLSNFLFYMFVYIYTYKFISQPVDFVLLLMPLHSSNCSLGGISERGKIFVKFLEVCRE